LIGNIAFCPHFHQPHFQLFKTREAVFNNSYKPWLALLREAVKIEGFYINLHFSGPLLYWMRDQKPFIGEEIKSLLRSNKIGIIGGLADEAFIHLSSKHDDVFFQLREYDRLCREFIGVAAPEWEGIHLVERECGEYLLREMSKAANLLGASPIYYLDAETFYESYFTQPGGKTDLFLKHFGFNDSNSKTTFSHIPKEMLYYGFRDEIGGVAFQCLPIHSEERYRLLKNHNFTETDNIIIKPKQYLDYLKQSMRQASEMAGIWGKNIEPMAVIFEDAEKFGQWSENPIEDAEWMLEFFNLVENDPDVKFNSLKQYIDTQSFFDTYPCRTSLAYPEWNNWTAKRGIRGVVYGDERLRRTIARIRLLEKQQNIFEERILDLIWNKGNKMYSDLIQRAVKNSNERFLIIENILTQNFGTQLCEQYSLINRIRNLLYQEDSKWASRHPCYGTTPYYDSLGLAYLEIAERSLQHLLYVHCSYNQPAVCAEAIDWDFDGEDEVLVKTPWQTLSVDMQGGCVDYHIVLSESLDFDSDKYARLLREGMNHIPAYHSVYQYAVPLVLTETDSQLSLILDAKGGRKERCRNSFRCDLFYLDNGIQKKIGDIANASFKFREIEKNGSEVKVSCFASLLLSLPDGGEAMVTVEKEFCVRESELEVKFSARFDREMQRDYFLAPQIVTSMTPSDEVEFNPSSYLLIEPGDNILTYKAENLIEMKDGVSYLYNQEKCVNWSGKLVYAYCVRTGNGDSFMNSINYCLRGINPIGSLNIEPAVRTYYEGFISDEQSRLGYNSSGLKLTPFVKFINSSSQLCILVHHYFNQPIINRTESTTPPQAVGACTLRNESNLVELIKGN
jgi:hypothetical protein